jgi:signal transduction histidine kinase
VAKYSGCKNVIIDLETNKNHIRLNIADDGKGFDTSKIKSGNGLRNMEQRAVTIDGNFRILSSPGQGTKLMLNIPIA